MSGTRVYLRGVDLAQLSKNFWEGKYEKMVFNNFGVVNTHSPSNLDQLIVSQNISDVESCYSALTGKKYLCVGKKVSTNGTYTRILPGVQTFHCMNCIREFTGFYWGIPLQKKIFGNKICFFTIDIFCSPNCTYRAIEQRKGNKIYYQSLNLFAEMFEAWTGKSFDSLKPASDPRLLQVLNGPLDWVQYHQLTISYTEKPSNIVFFPVIEFLEPDP